MATQAQTALKKPARPQHRSVSPSKRMSNIVSNYAELGNNATQLISNLEVFKDTTGLPAGLAQQPICKRISFITLLSL